MAGMALAVLADVSYQLPRPVFSTTGPDGSSLTGYSTVPFVNWYEIPATIGFLILALAMWWIMTAPARPSAKPGERLWLALLFVAADVLFLRRHASWEGVAQTFVSGAVAVTGVILLCLTVRDRKTSEA